MFMESEKLGTNFMILFLMIYKIRKHDLQVVMDSKVYYKFLQVICWNIVSS